MRLFGEGFLQRVERAGADVAVHHAESAESESSCSYLRSMAMSMRVSVVGVPFLMMAIVVCMCMMCVGERLGVLGSY
ncbi:unannotated protein [freshwater metagenome]|uniref:Unannotated protein n=1 Tax=freshwater metagenome TaxID=449393 RepID=A0A6J6I9V7_9ZZZZ